MIKQLEKEDKGYQRSREDLERTLETCQQETEVSDDDHHIQIRIADNGPAISPEVLPEIFEQYFTTKSVGKGTDIGLAISHQIITDRHSGQLSVNSALGEGAEFVITLPVVAA